jgi:hypothetical protein
LEKYLADADGDLDVALAVYERNCRLSEAFYTPLQSLEICFRNALHQQMVALYGDDWLRNGTAPLYSDAIQNIESITADLGTGVRPGRIVAELRFSFWVGLIGPRYDATLWRQGLYKAFLAKGGIKRSVAHGRFNALRRLRNRVAHHEPIFTRPLPRLHQELIEAIGWMCRDTAQWTAHQSRFEDVFRSHG